MKDINGAMHWFLTDLLSSDSVFFLWKDRLLSIPLVSYLQLLQSEIAGEDLMKYLHLGCKTMGLFHRDGGSCSEKCVYISCSYCAMEL